MIKNLTKKIFLIKKGKGFTMMELLIIIILVALLAQLAIFGYRKAIEDSKYDKAKVVLEEVANAVVRFNIDYPARKLASSNSISRPSSTQTCNIRKSGSDFIDPSYLISCGYLENRTWTDLDFNYYTCSSSAAAEGCKRNNVVVAAAYMSGKAKAGSYSGKEYMYIEGSGISPVSYSSGVYYD